MSAPVHAGRETPSDLAITGGLLVTAAGRHSATVLIREGRIEALLPPGRAVSARRSIDATGLMVMPGAVDAHVHCREPGLTHKEGFASATRAAAAGGVTTILVMPTDNPWTLTAAQFAEKRDLLPGKAHVDVGLQAGVAADLSTLGELEALADLGAASFELFLGDVPAAFTFAENGTLERALARIAAAGLPAGITPADDGVIQARLAELPAGPLTAPAFAATRPPLSEALGVARACLVAEATGAKIHLRQMSARQSIAVLADARRRVPGITAEATPHNLLLTLDDAVRLGPWAKVVPPLRTGDDCAAAWDGLVGGAIDIVATDHAPHAVAEKEAGLADLAKAPGGFPGVQTLLPLMLDAAAAGRLTYEDVVRLVAEAPARIFGLFPRKGTIAEGADADLVLVDPQRDWAIRNEDQESLARVSPFAGRALRGRPVLALLRGAVIMRDGRPEGEPNGDFVAPARR